MYWLPRATVLVPTDLSHASVDAVHAALSMVEAERNVHVLHVAEPLPDHLRISDVSDKPDDESVADRRALGQSQLVEFAAEHDLDGVTLAADAGDRALVITRYAENCGVDLIIMVTRYHTESDRTSLSRVAKRVLHNAECAVLVLRPDCPPAKSSTGQRIRDSNGFCPIADRPGPIVNLH